MAFYPVKLCTDKDDGNIRNKNRHYLHCLTPQLSYIMMFLIRPALFPRLQIALQKHFRIFYDVLAAVAGFEPAHHGVKFRCLTELGYTAIFVMRAGICTPHDSFFVFAPPYNKAYQARIHLRLLLPFKRYRLSCALSYDR